MAKHNENLKEIILASAKDISLEHSINEINIRKVAKKSNISIGTVYNYFPTKADLLVAVIEDFWKEAFTKIDIRALGDKSFYEKIEEIYDSLYSYLYNFKENWLEQISLLNAQEKEVGRKRQEEYFARIRTIIISLMDSDKSIDKYIWSSSITKEKTAQFIFDNMLLNLKKGERNFEFFIEILKKNNVQLKSYPGMILKMNESEHCSKNNYEVIYMQGIMETLFDVVYLSTVIIIGVIMITRSGDNKQYKMFGIMSVVLGSGDAFHLVPRSYALLTTGLESKAAALGIGKLITSITMTVFYVILYYIWRNRYDIKERKGLTASIYLLAIIRIVLCLFPQNDWLNYYAPVSWGIYRNIPFALMGIIIIWLFYTETKKHNDKNFRFMWLAIVLSFGFYIPVVLWADTISIIGILMIPKTLAYVWVVLMGYNEFKDKLKG